MLLAITSWVAFTLPIGFIHPPVVRYFSSGKLPVVIRYFSSGKLPVVIRYFSSGNPVFYSGNQVLFLGLSDSYLQVVGYFYLVSQVLLSGIEVCI